MSRNRSHRKKKTTAKSVFQGIGLELGKTTKAGLKETRKTIHTTGKAQRKVIKESPKKIDEGLKKTGNIVEDLAKGPGKAIDAIGKNLPYIAAGAVAIGIGLVALKL